MSSSTRRLSTVAGRLIRGVGDGFGGREGGLAPFRGHVDFTSGFARGRGLGAGRAGGSGEKVRGLFGGRGKGGVRGYVVCVGGFDSWSKSWVGVGGCWRGKVGGWPRWDAEMSGKGTLKGSLACLGRCGPETSEIGGRLVDRTDARRIQHTYTLHTGIPYTQVYNTHDSLLANAIVNMTGYRQSEQGRRQ